jgi:hypothetical protein
MAEPPDAGHHRPMQPIQIAESRINVDDGVPEDVQRDVGGCAR